MPTRLRDALRAGALSLALAVFAEAWELLARQVPSSPWHVFGFPAEIRTLALRAWIVGLAVFALAPRAWERSLARDSRRAAIALGALYLGGVLSFASLFYGAATGVFGVQLQDTGRAGRGEMLARIAGDVLLLVALGITANAASSSTSPPEALPGPKQQPPGPAA